MCPTRNCRAQCRAGRLRATRSMASALRDTTRRGSCMPEQKTLERARRDKRTGKAPSTQAGEFVREEIHHVREGKHGARSTKQAIAIGLSKARRAGVKLPAPPRGSKATTRRSAAAASRAGHTRTRTSPRRAVPSTHTYPHVAAARACDPPRPEARRTRCRVRRGAVTTGKNRSAETVGVKPACRGAPGGPHERSANSPGRSSESRADAKAPGDRMIRKLKSGEYRLYSRKKNPKTGRRRNLGTFGSRAAAEKHERAVQFFKRH
jgi:hypothetical protein